MTRAVTAIYVDGLLKPLQALSLKEHQQVLLIIVPFDAQREQVSYSPEWVAEMERKANAWLMAQPGDVSREPLPMVRALQQAIDQAFDETVAAIRSHSVAFDDEEIAADVEAALAEVRFTSTAERQRLEAEVQALLDEIAADVT